MCFTYVYMYFCMCMYGFACLCSAAKMLRTVCGTTRLCLCIRHAYATEKFINKISNLRIYLVACMFFGSNRQLLALLLLLFVYICFFCALFRSYLAYS